VIRSKEYLTAIRPAGDVLTMETMLFADELIDPGDIDELPEEDEVRATDREVAMARQLIESLATEFEPGKYRDEYRDRVLDLIERKADGQEVAVTAEPEAPQAVPDLMAALEASLAAASGGKAKLQAAGANGAKKPAKATPARAKKPAAKKPAAKKQPKAAAAKKPRAKSRA
jgi:DNA end-binding protein Ku